MGHGVQKIVAEVLVKTAMPLAQGAWSFGGHGWAVGAKPEIRRLDFELVDGTLDFARLLRLGGNRNQQAHYEDTKGAQHYYDFTSAGWCNGDSANALTTPRRRATEKTR
jgi:hypothetical protein